MRCQFCGWDNPDGKVVCEKCNKPLVISNELAMPAAGGKEEPSTVKVPVKHGGGDRPTDRQPGGPAGALKKTVREQDVLGSTVVQMPTTCPQCGFPMEGGACPSCGYAGGEVEKAPAPAGNQLKKTVRPERKAHKAAGFTLTPISETNGLPEGDTIAFSGNEVVLNRDNTDPNNATITSAEQAAVTCENGTWQIEDRSEFSTTFVQAARRIRLESGDLLLLGNQLYRFDVQ